MLISKQSWGVALVTGTASHYSNDPATVPDVTSYTYNGILGRRLTLTQTNPDGSWVRYDYDTNGNLSHTYQPWLDGPSSPEFATLANCHATTTSSMANSVYSTSVSTETIMGITRSTQTTSTQLGTIWRTHGALCDISTSSDGYNTTQTVTESGTGTMVASIDATGAETDCTHTVGLYDPTNGQFYDIDGGGWTLSDTQTGPDGLTYASDTDPNGCLCFERMLYNGQVISVTQHVYDVTGQYELQTLKDGVEIYSAQYDFGASIDGGDVVTATDGQGIYHPNGLLDHGTNLERDEDGSGWRDACKLITSYAAKWIYHHDDSSGSRWRARFHQHPDQLTPRAEAVSSVDQEGRVTSCAYLNGGRTVQQFDGLGNSDVADRQLSGRPVEIHHRRSRNGGAVPQLRHQQQWHYDGYHRSYGDATGTRWTSNTTLGNGNDIIDKKPSSSGGITTTTYTYSGGRVSQVSSGGVTQTYVCMISAGQSALELPGQTIALSATCYQDSNAIWWKKSTKTLNGDALNPSETYTTQTSLNTGPVKLWSALARRAWILLRRP